MKSFFAILLLTFTLPVSALSFDVGVIAPLAFGADFTGNSTGIWPGFSGGGGITAGCRFLEDPRVGTAWYVEVFGILSYDRYSLSGGYEWEIMKDFLFIPIEAKASYLFSVRNASLWEFGVSLGCVLRFPAHSGTKA